MGRVYMAEGVTACFRLQALSHHIDISTSLHHIEKRRGRVRPSEMTRAPLAVA